MIIIKNSDDYDNLLISFILNANNPKLSYAIPIGESWGICKPLRCLEIAARKFDPEELKESR